MMKTISDVISALTKAYVERQPSQAHVFVDEWFSNNPVIIGTSFNELFVGKQGTIDLLQSDWQYWYDVSIHQTPKNIIATHAGTFVRLSADLLMKFEDSIERDQRYISAVQEIAKYSCTAMQKAHHIIWMLSHFTAHHSNTPRTYQRHLSIDLLLIEEEGELKIKLAHFYSPEADTPDILLDNEDYCKEIELYQQANLPHLVIEDLKQLDFLAHQEWIEGTIHSVDVNNQTVVIGLAKETQTMSTDMLILDRLKTLDGLKNTHDLYRISQQLQWITRGSQSTNSYLLKRIVALTTDNGLLLTESYPYYYILEEKDTQDIRLS